MEEIIFLVKESAEGGYTAKGLGVSIFTEADTMEDLRIAVKDAVYCHYDEITPGTGACAYLMLKECFSGA